MSYEYLGGVLNRHRFGLQMPSRLSATKAQACCKHQGPVKNASLGLAVPRLLSLCTLIACKTATAYGKPSGDTAYVWLRLHISVTMKIALEDVHRYNQRLNTYSVPWEVRHG
jgi:hypothetical protein